MLFWEKKIVKAKKKNKIGKIIKFRSNLDIMNITLGKISITW